MYHGHALAPAQKVWPRVAMATVPIVFYAVVLFVQLGERRVGTRRLLRRVYSQGRGAVLRGRAARITWMNEWRMNAVSTASRLAVCQLNKLELSGSVYTKCQRQCCDNSTMTLVILFSLNTMESLQIGAATHFRATSLFSMRTLSLVSL